jgi:hypothetical protein
MCKDAPQPPAGVGEAALKNAETAAEALDFYKTIYESDIKPRMARDAEIRDELTADFLGASRKQQRFADEQAEFYRDTFQPLEGRMVQEAMDFDSDENVQRRMGIASARVKSEMSNAAQQNRRALAAYGVNPNSGAFARANNMLTTQQGVQSAAAQTGAAFDTMDRGIALRAGAAGFGRNMPNTAAQFFAGSGASGANAANISSQGIQNVGAGANVMGQGFNTAIQGNTAAGNLYLGQYNAQMQGHMANQQMIGNLASGIGTFAGMKFGAADGGTREEMKPVPEKKSKRGVRSKQNYAKSGKKPHRGAGLVRGPGGPVDDEVPAYLSNNEYVLPADTTAAIGKKTLDAIVAQTHTPAAVQRGLSRSA